MKAAPLKPISARPPMRTSSASDLERLEKLQEWTEEPSKRAAEDIGQPVKESAPEAPTAPVTAAAAPQEPQKPQLPWEGVPESSYRQFNIRMPVKLGIQLKWLGDTTFDSNMTKIILASLQKTVDEMLEQRGVK